MTGVRIRAAALADAQTIARVHVQAWRESYRGLVPDAMIEALSVERNAKMWTTLIEAGKHDVLLVETAGDIAGFCSAGDARGEALGTTAEVTTIYLLDRIKRQGLGRALFTATMRALIARGHRSVGLWVLTENHGTRAFYQALGGRTGPTRDLNHSHGTLPEIAYVWDDLSPFAE